MLAKYLADLKDNLKENEAILLGDFAGNYQFLIQDEVKGYHWSIKYRSLHWIVVYKSGTELTEKPYVLSLKTMTMVFHSFTKF